MMVQVVSAEEITQKPKIPMIPAIIYAILNEIHQLFVHAREGTHHYIFIDTFGAVIEVMIIKKVQH
jgi:VanZ family protein